MKLLELMSAIHQVMDMLNQMTSQQGQFHRRRPMQSQVRIKLQLVDQLIAGRFYNQKMKLHQTLELLQRP